MNLKRLNFISQIWEEFRGKFYKLLQDVLCGKNMSMYPDIKPVHGEIERLISVPFYAEVSGQEFSDPHSAYLHFMYEGQQRGLNPSPFFYTEWYSWLHPDIKQFPTVLDHFAWCAAGVPTSPAPFLDPVTMLEGNRKHYTMFDVLVELTEGRNTAVSPSLEEHLARLAVQQSNVHNSIQSRYIRRTPSGRRRLVWIQTGSRFSVMQWFRPDIPRRWDLMCNWYERNGLDLRYGEIHLLQAGTKSTAMYHVLRHDRDLFNGYDQLLFLDDDLDIAYEDIDLLFDIAEHEGLSLFQPALAPGSYGVWNVFVRQFPEGARLTTGVEIMMPGFTREALFSCTEIFGRSVSGYGLDFLFSEHIRRNGGLCGVIDSVSVGHNMSIDEQNGAYYRLMRRLGIQHQLELYAAIHELGKFPEFANVVSAV